MARGGLLIGLGISGGIAAYLLTREGAQEKIAEVAAAVEEDVSAAADAVAATAEDVLVNLGALPSSAKKYLDLVNTVAQEQGEDPLVLLAIGWHESRWGDVLRPKNASGTGDWILRAPDQITDAMEPYVQAVKTVPAGWSVGKGSIYTYGSPPTYYLPSDGLGWGRGLMQIDLVAALQMDADWRDPYANITKGALILKEKRDMILRNVPNVSEDMLERATIAAYNAGSRVLPAVRKGGDVDAVTTGKNYSADVLSNVEKWSVA